MRASASSALYDAAVRFTDEQVGRIVDALERRGIAKRLGEIPEFGEDRLRRAFQHLFHPEKTKVPS